MQLPININQEMLKRAQLNQNISPRPIEESRPDWADEIVNPYPEVVSKVLAGELDPLAPTPDQIAKENAIKRAKDAVKGMSTTNGSRRAVEAIAEVLEGPQGD